jgi:hypothetical protein
MVVALFYHLRVIATMYLQAPARVYALAGVKGFAAVLTQSSWPGP